MDIFYPRWASTTTERNNAFTIIHPRTVSADIHLAITRDIINPSCLHGGSYKAIEQLITGWLGVLGMEILIGIVSFGEKESEIDCVLGAGEVLNSPLEIPNSSKSKYLLFVTFFR